MPERIEVASVEWASRETPDRPGRLALLLFAPDLPGEGPAESAGHEQHTTPGRERRDQGGGGAEGDR